MPDSKILIIGRNGQLGGALLQILGSRGLSLDEKELDLSRPQEAPKVLDSLFSRKGFSAIINAAAYTQVDKAESEPELARAINGEAPGVLAKWAAEHDLPFVHFSTDYVFPGGGTRPWAEEDPTQPLSTYGLTKLEGENAVSRYGTRWLTFRSSWIFNPTGQNFLKTMLKLGAEREEIRVVADQFGAPTYAPHLAQAALKALDLATKEADFPSGMFHLCNLGETTWHGFAEAIFVEAHSRGIPLKVRRVVAIPTEEYPTPARRPLNSRLSCLKAQKLFKIRLPEWQVGLKECVKALV